MTLPAYMYKDPADVLESKQERQLKKSCVGCIHAMEYEFKDSREKICDKGKAYGRRCELYTATGSEKNQ